MVLRVCCTISFGIIDNIYLHSEMGMSDGTFSLPVRCVDYVSQILFDVGDLSSNISNSSISFSVGFSVL